MFSLFNFLTYAFVSAFTPGPNTISSMSNASRVGLRRALVYNFGILTGQLIVMQVCTFSIRSLSRLLPQIRTPMLYISAGYILYLAWKTYTSSSELEAEGGEKGFLSGVILQFINPKLYIYVIVSMDRYVIPYYGDNNLALAGFAVFLALLGFTSTVLWAAFGSVFRLLFSKHAKVTNTVMALLLAYCAIAFFF